MNWLFQIPWSIPIALTIAGVALFIYANNRLKTRLKRAGLALVLLAIVLVIVSYLIDTPAEVVAANTRQLVQAVVKRDSAALDQLLDRDATAYAWNKSDIIKGAEYYADITGLSGARILQLQVEPAGPDFTSYLVVWSQHSGGRFPIPDLNSSWKLDWIKVNDRWLIQTIEPLQIGQTQRDELERQYLSRPVPRQ